MQLTQEVLSHGCRHGLLKPGSFNTVCEWLGSVSLCCFCSTLTRGFRTINVITGTKRNADDKPAILTTDRRSDRIGTSGRVLARRCWRRAVDRRIGVWWRGLDSNQRRRTPADLQSAPFSHSGTPPTGQTPDVSPGPASVKPETCPGWRGLTRCCKFRVGHFVGLALPPENAGLNQMQRAQTTR